MPKCNIDQWIGLWLVGGVMGFVLLWVIPFFKLPDSFALTAFGFVGMMLSLIGIVGAGLHCFKCQRCKEALNGKDNDDR